MSDKKFKKRKRLQRVAGRYEFRMLACFYDEENNPIIRIGPSSLSKVREKLLELWEVKF